MNVVRAALIVVFPFVMTWVVVRRVGYELRTIFYLCRRDLRREREDFRLAWRNADQHWREIKDTYQRGRQKARNRRGES